MRMRSVNKSNGAHGHYRTQSSSVVEGTTKELWVREWAHLVKHLVCYPFEYVLGLLRKNIPQRVLLNLLLRPSRTAEVLNELADFTNDAQYKCNYKK